MNQFDLFDSLYTPTSSSVQSAARRIKLAVFDVDGVLTDGSIYLGTGLNGGAPIELKAFSSKDGYGIKALQHCGIQTAVITGRKATFVAERCASLQVNHVIQGCEDKAEALKSLQATYQVSTEQTASIGDDIPDLGMFQVSTLKVAVQDAHPAVKAVASMVTSRCGGQGAAREFCDLLLAAHGKLTAALGSSS